MREDRRDSDRKRRKEIEKVRRGKTRERAGKIEMMKERG